MGWGYKPTMPGIVRACFRKQRMEEWEARCLAKKLAKRTPGATYYPCPFCEKWHVTSSIVRPKYQK